MTRILEWLGKFISWLPSLIFRGLFFFRSKKTEEDLVDVTVGDSADLDHQKVVVSPSRIYSNLPDGKAARGIAEKNPEVMVVFERMTEKLLGKYGESAIDPGKFNASIDKVLEKESQKEPQSNFRARADFYKYARELYAEEHSAKRELIKFCLLMEKKELLAAMKASQGEGIQGVWGIWPRLGQVGIELEKRPADKPNAESKQESVLSQVNAQLEGGCSQIGRQRESLVERSAFKGPVRM